MYLFNVHILCIIIYMKDIEYYGFIWDEEKAKYNKKKHGISFETAVLVFCDPLLYELYDEDHSLQEERFKYIGCAMGELMLFVVATDRDEKIRIISARKATKNERIKYYENAKKIQIY